MILLTKKLNVPDARKTVFFQCLQCVLQAVPLAWLAVKSGSVVLQAILQSYYTFLYVLNIIYVLMKNNLDYANCKLKFILCVYIMQYLIVFCAVIASDFHYGHQP